MTAKLPNKGDAQAVTLPAVRWPPGGVRCSVTTTSCRLSLSDAVTHAHDVSDQGVVVLGRMQR